METAVEVPGLHVDVSSKRAGVFQRSTCRSASTDARPKTLKPANNSSKASPLVRKLLHREETASNQNRPPIGKFVHGGGGKRRQSFSTASDYKQPFNKRRRRGDLLFTPPTKFLLGGNINDPLNLASFADDEVNKKANEVTPKSSPIPTPKHRTQVEVLIPPNINDPLNLNSGEDIEFSLISPRSRKRNRRRSKRKSRSEDDGPEQGDASSGPVEDAAVAADPNATVQVAAATSTSSSSLTTATSATTPRKVSAGSQPSCSKDGADKIVSPVVPQGSPTKFNRRKSSAAGGGASRDVRRSQQHHQQGGRRAKQVYFREKDAHFQYGNYNRYYGYRNNGGQEDPRLKVMQASWLDGKDVLDIGCNVGHFTLSLARGFSPRKVIGLDIDGRLIKAARRNVRHYLTAALAGEMRFPVSMAICHGPIAAAALPGRESEPVTFPNNVFFVQGNYILDSDVLLEAQREEFDTILCLSLTKWVHLNWGDDGVRRLFKRMFRQLRPGGRMLLEAQPFHSYVKKKKLTETTYKHFHDIRLRPEQFNEYLLSPEVGFASCELIDTPSHASKGFQRPIYLFTKAASAAEEQCDTVEGECSASAKAGCEKKEGERDSGSERQEREATTEKRK
ncbi:unnamed protein product [Ixodes hexagonus]